MHVGEELEEEEDLQVQGKEGAGVQSRASSEDLPKESDPFFL